ncbi:hypothetical protein YC2023_091128 [Brassica napus]
MSACLAAFLSKPIDTDGSVSVPTMLLLGVGGEQILKVGKESRVNNEANIRPYGPVWSS